METKFQATTIFWDSLKILPWVDFGVSASFSLLSLQIATLQLHINPLLKLCDAVKPNTLLLLAFVNAVVFLHHSPHLLQHKFEVRKTGIGRQPHVQELSPSCFRLGLVVLRFSTK